MRQFILGTDWWTDCDDAVALRLLARAHKAGQIRLLGVVINACMEDSVRSVEGFLNLEGVRDVPLGIDRDASDFGGKPPYQKWLSQFAERNRSNSDAEDAVRLYRRLLAGVKENEKAELAEIGFMQAAAGLLQSGPDDLSPLSGVELVAEKVSKLWVMAGRWDLPIGRENNFCRAPRTSVGADALVRLCPVPITFLGFEIGVDVITGAGLGKDDPLGTVLRLHGSENGRSSWDPMLVSMALAGDEAAAGYSVVRGRASVDPLTGENRFVPGADGPHAYVVKAHPDGYYSGAIDRKIR